MPRTKLSDEFAPKKKKQLTLAEIPDLAATLTIAQAAELAGIGYQGIKALITSRKIPSIESGAKQMIPTWEFVVQLKIFPERLLEKVYLRRLGLESEKEQTAS